MTAETAPAAASEPTYRHSPDMGEISGFGGAYEGCCQDMLEAGVKWLAAHPAADLTAHGFANVTGIFIADSDDAKGLERAILDAAKGEATGAMHHAVMARCFWIAREGWDAYCVELRSRNRDEGETVQ